MAAISVLPSPHAPSNNSNSMASRRFPLANNPNAANSPFRSVAPVNGKRARAQSTDPREVLQGQPPSKKHLLDPINDENASPRPSFTRQSLSQQEAESKVFLRKPGNAPPTAFEKKLAAAAAGREKKPSTTQKSAEKPRGGMVSLENIRQWQRHYRKLFPSYVFYFESVSEDVRARVSRQIQSLGAKEEKFFSKSVTHVVTTRPVPAEQNTTSPEDGQSNSSKPENLQRTIDPSLLARPEDNQANGALRRTTDLLDATLQSRGPQMPQSLHNIEPRKLLAHNTDILSKARELGIKIWALEKLQRMMVTMFSADTGDQSNGPLTRSHAATNLAAGTLDLGQLLRNEKATGPADRDMTVAPQDMCHFRGYYLFVHDMDEKTRPVMMRDYPKAGAKEDGKWPQFRITPIGRCPFVEDKEHTKRLRLQEQQAAEAKEREAARARTRSRAAAMPDAIDLTAPSLLGVLNERSANLRRSPRKTSHDTTTMAKPLEPPAAPNRRQASTDGMPPLFGSAQANMRPQPRFIGGEPVASGVQPSNITSAIRSQIMSSTAISSTAPGARMGTSKEIHALKRKVLERGTTAQSGQNLTSSYMNDMRAAINGDRAPAPRAAKRRAQECLGQIYEEPENGENGARGRSKADNKTRRKPAPQKELKPGYCENCRDKFDDFDEHCQSRKHRKFALAADNWTQLDGLLAQLQRPLRTVPAA